MNVEEYSPVCNFCFTTSYGTREKEATVFPIAAADATVKVFNVDSDISDDDESLFSKKGRRISFE